VQAVLVLAAAMLSPLLGLALLLWLAHLEDTLTRDVQRARRKPAPPPILAIPVARTPVAETHIVSLPEQRAAREVEVSGIELSGAEGGAV
jgi:hypothetical protein